MVCPFHARVAAHLRIFQRPGFVELRGVEPAGAQQSGQNGCKQLLKQGLEQDIMRTCWLVGCAQLLVSRGCQAYCFLSGSFCNCSGQDNLVSPTPPNPGHVAMWVEYTAAGYVVFVILCYLYCCLEGALNT
jgi:hypothetical protein